MDLVFVLKWVKTYWMFAPYIPPVCIEKIGSSSVTRKKSPNFYKSCPKMASLEKLKILTSLQKLPKNVGFLGKLIVAKSFKKLPKVQ